MKPPVQKLARVLNGLDEFSSNKTAHPVFVAGIKYASLFQADIDSGIRAASIWKALRRTGGGPVQIIPTNGRNKENRLTVVTDRRRVLVVMESWVAGRAGGLKMEYDL